MSFPTIRTIRVIGVAAASFAIPLSPTFAQDWPAPGGSPVNLQYSPLTQINRTTVKQLQVAWTFDTKQANGWFEHSPIMVKGVLYGLTPLAQVIALDAATGQLLWKSSLEDGAQVNRGINYWTDPRRPDDPGRLLVGIGNNLFALDVKTGKLIPTFGDKGHVEVGRWLSRPGGVGLTNGGAIYNDVIIVSGRMEENMGASPGDILAFDLRTGKLRWSFHTIPHPGEFGYNTWPKDAWKYSGAANCWGGMALDSARGIVYVPTGSAVYDFFGANRVGDDLFANSLIALNAKTGKRIWHFQAVKHDIWDWDFPSHPLLLTIQHEGKRVDVVAQPSKQGFIYLFNRKTGKPVFPIEYRKVPQTDVPGEVTAATQPFPTKPVPFARQQLTENDLTTRTPEAHQFALDWFRKLRNGGMFTPPTVGRGTIVRPALEGGGEWGGAAADPETGVMYVNANESPAVMTLSGNYSPNTPAETQIMDGQDVYMTTCSGCHLDSLQGQPPNIPSLIDVGKRLSNTQITQILRKGRQRMPAFPKMPANQRRILINYLTTGKRDSISIVIPEQKNKPSGGYGLAYELFRDQNGYPAIAPPWGTLNAIDLNTGESKWRVPLGEYPDLTAKGIPVTGSENYGGPIVTAGGLVFIGATCFDNKFRAFDKETGELLWETVLPYGAGATPMSYAINGRQFVVVAAGGGRDGKVWGGVYVAFALPQKQQ